MPTSSRAARASMSSPSALAPWSTFARCALRTCAVLRSDCARCGPSRAALASRFAAASTALPWNAKSALHFSLGLNHWQRKWGCRSEKVSRAAARTAISPRLSELRPASVWGSAGMTTAALGVPTLDGWGAVGDGAHSAHEHVLVKKMPERAALLAVLLGA